MNEVTYRDAFAQGVSLLQRCSECALCAEHQHVSAGDRAGNRLTRVTLQTRKQIAGQIADFSLVAYHDNPDAVRAQIASEIITALNAEHEHYCRLLCEWCGNSSYNLVWHHDEWRHYRLSDMHVEYCDAAVLRGKG